MRRLVYPICSYFGSAVPRLAQRLRGRWTFVLCRCFATAWVCLQFPGHGLTMERAVDLELVLAIDISNSMDLEEAALVRQGFIRAFRHPDGSCPIVGGNWFSA